MKKINCFLLVTLVTSLNAAVPEEAAPRLEKARSASWSARISCFDCVSAANTKGAFAGFGLDGATPKPDESSTEASFGRKLTNSAVVEGGTSVPDAARPFIAGLVRASGR
jgi:lipid-binding SYLF domain-containing protein